MIYARQIPPEYQESPLSTWGWPEELTCNVKHSRQHTSKAYELLMRYADECEDEIENLKSAGSLYRNATEVIHDMLPPQHKVRYATQEIKKWKELLKGYSSCTSSQEAGYIVEMLTLLTGEKYVYAVIRGCSQGEWEEIFYPESYGESFRDNFETAYFNLGSEWIIHDEDSEPKDPDEICGYSMYLMADGYSSDEVKEELSEQIGASPEEIVLYSFAGWKRSAEYYVA